MVLSQKMELLNPFAARKKELAGTMELGDVALVSLKDHPGEELVHHLHRLLNEDYARYGSEKQSAFFDLTLSFGANHTVPESHTGEKPSAVLISSLILAAFSPMMRYLFLESRKEASEIVIILPDYGQDAINQVASVFRFENLGQELALSSDVVKLLIDLKIELYGNEVPSHDGDRHSHIDLRSTLAKTISDRFLEISGQHTTTNNQKYCHVSLNLDANNFKTDEPRDTANEDNLSDYYELVPLDDPEDYAAMSVCETTLNSLDGPAEDPFRNVTSNRPAPLSLDTSKSATNSLSNETVFHPLLLDTHPTIKLQADLLKMEKRTPRLVLEDVARSALRRVAVMSDLKNKVSEKADFGGVELGKCAACSERFSTRIALKQHLQTHIGEARFKCKLCSFSTLKSSSMKLHLMRHANEKPYRCKYCPYACRTNGRLIQHLKMKHNGLRGNNTYSCSVCKQSHDTMKNLILHRRTHGRATFKCEDCPYMTSKRYLLANHCRIHTGEKPFLCYVCQKAFSRNNKLLLHMRTVHQSIKGPEGAISNFDSFQCPKQEDSDNVANMTVQVTEELIENWQQQSVTEKSFRCSVCSVLFTKLSTLDEHIRRKHQQQLSEKNVQYCCPNCAFSTSKVGVFQRHLRCNPCKPKPLKPESLMCHLCVKVFRFERNLARHMESHNSAFPLKCEHCSFATFDRFELQQHSCSHELKCELCSYTTHSKHHLKRHHISHLTEKPFKCSQCSFSTGDRYHLVDHIATKHTSERPFVCDLCTATFSTARLMNEHRHRLHVKEKLKCSICPFETSYPRNIRDHMFTHTGEKPFTCEYCDFATTKKRTVKEHLRTHMNERPFQCNACNYASSTSQALMRHKRSHTGEKPYTCKWCQFSAAHNVSLKSHVRSAHPEESL